MSGLDGQFVAVTLAALWGGWVLLRPLLSLRKKKTAGPASACGHCAAGSSCAKGSAGGETLVTLGTGPKPR